MTDAATVKSQDAKVLDHSLLAAIPTARSPPNESAIKDDSDEERDEVKPVQPKIRRESITHTELTKDQSFAPMSNRRGSQSYHYNRTVQTDAGSRLFHLRRMSDC